MVVALAVLTACLVRGRGGRLATACGTIALILALRLSG